MPDVKSLSELTTTLLQHTDQEIIVLLALLGLGASEQGGVIVSAVELAKTIYVRSGRDIRPKQLVSAVGRLEGSGLLFVERLDSGSARFVCPLIFNLDVVKTNLDIEQISSTNDVEVQIEKVTTTNESNKFVCPPRSLRLPVLIQSDSRALASRGRVLVLNVKSRIVVNIKRHVIAQRQRSKLLKSSPFHRFSSRSVNAVKNRTVVHNATRHCYPCFQFRYQRLIGAQRCEQAFAARASASAAHSRAVSSCKCLMVEQTGNEQNRSGLLLKQKNENENEKTKNENDPNQSNLDVDRQSPGQSSAENQTLCVDSVRENTGEPANGVGEGPITEDGEQCNQKNAIESECFRHLESKKWRVSTAWPKFACWKNKQFIAVHIEPEAGQLSLEEQSIVHRLQKSGVQCHLYVPGEGPDDGLKLIGPARNAKLSVATHPFAKDYKETTIRLIDLWARCLGKNPKRIKVTEKRLEQVKQRLLEGYSPVEMAMAVKGISYSDFHIKKGYVEFDRVIRNAEQVDKFFGIWTAKAPIKEIVAYIKKTGEYVESRRKEIEEYEHEITEYKRQQAHIAKAKEEQAKEEQAQRKEDEEDEEFYRQVKADLEAQQKAEQKANTKKE